MSVRVLITDGHQRSALAVVRSLGKAGHECLVAAPEFPAIAATSRYCHSSCKLDLTSVEHGYERLREIIRTSDIELVIPISDHAMTVLARASSGSRLAGAKVAGPGAGAYRALSDKVELARYAKRIDLPVPKSIVVQHQSELAEATRRIGFPCVVKPHRSVILRDGETHQLAVDFAASRGEAVEIARNLIPEAFPVLVQERIEGPGEGVFLLFDGDRVRARFAHRRLREFPPSGGASTYRESIPVEPELLRASRNLLSAVGWEGVAMVEFKRSDGTGRPYLMEVNGRFWGSLQLAVDAGVDFPTLLVDMVLDRPYRPPPAYRLGIRTRWFWGDVDYLLTRLRREPKNRHLPAHERDRSRLSILLEVLHVQWGERIEELRLEDPAPFFLGLRRRLRRLRKRLPR